MWATYNSYIVIRSSSTFQFLHGIIICFHVHIHADRDSEQSSSRWTTDVPCCWSLVVSSSFYFVRPEMLVTVIARPSSSDQKRRTETIPLFMWDNALPHQDNRSDYIGLFSPYLVGVRHTPIRSVCLGVVSQFPK